MIKSIEFREGILCLAITGPRTGTSCESHRSIEFDFGEGGAIAEIHHRELMDFLYAVDPESSYEIGNMVFELLGAQARVCRIDFYRLDSASESLEGSASPDVQVELACSAVERAGSEEDIPF
jgi:hypothetical protein